MKQSDYLKQIATSIFTESLAECSVEHAFVSKVTPGKEGSPHAFHLEGDGEIDLSAVKRVVVIAMGKGGNPMLRSFLRRVHVPADCRVSGVLISPEEPQQIPDGIAFFRGGHPQPNQASFAGARAALSLIEEASAESILYPTFCFFLISGGASAMMELPLDETISLEDTVTFHRVLVHSGASISEINCVRKHFSAVKGGRLGVAASAMPSLTIVVSDVPAGHLDALASGPTLPDTSTVDPCREVLERYHLLGQFPLAVRRFFESGMLVETPKPHTFRPRVFTLLSADDLALAARRRAEAMGFATVVDNSCDDWDYRAATEYLLGRLSDLRREFGRVCLISAGEVTVKLPVENDLDGNGEAVALLHGTGGRNQHFALYAATLLDGLDQPTVVFSAGSDGVDGNSLCAGGLVDERTLSTAVSRDGSGQGVDGEDLAKSAQDALLRFDSNPFLERLKATVFTGPTGNNLRDLRLFLAE